MEGGGGWRREEGGVHVVGRGADPLMPNAPSPSRCHRGVLHHHVDSAVWHIPTGHLLPFGSGCGSRWGGLEVCASPLGAGRGAGVCDTTHGVGRLGLLEVNPASTPLL